MINKKLQEKNELNEFGKFLVALPVLVFILIGVAIIGGIIGAAIGGGIGGGISVWVSNLLNKKRKNDKK